MQKEKQDTCDSQKLRESHASRRTEWTPIPNATGGQGR